MVHSSWLCDASETGSTNSSFHSGLFESGIGDVFMSSGWAIPATLTRSIAMGVGLRPK